MTLAFALSALKTLAEPGTAFADARQWTRYVGVVSAKPPSEVKQYLRTRRIREDFMSGSEDPVETLESVRDQFESDRYVVVGTPESSQSSIEATNWEHLSVDEAAVAAEWVVGDQRRPDGVPDREDWPR